jgi:DNA mismatch repair protein MutS
MSGGGTPLMEQYRTVKAQHQDAILLFRMGDFYEMFYEDAQVGARALNLTLTSRNNGGAAEVPLAGVPVRAAAEYVKRLVQQGFRVAICEQVEDPRLAKGIVKREVVETITPGAAFADDLLDGTRNNFLCAVHVIGNDVGVAAVDVSTGEFRVAVRATSELAPLLARYAPRELVLAHDAVIPVPLDGVLQTPRDAWHFDGAQAIDELTRRFGVHSLEGFALPASAAPALAAAGALLRYLRELQPAGLPHLMRPVLEPHDGVMPLDEMTRRNLELVESLRGGGTDGTLLDVLDATQTPMGARLLRQWVLAPLTDRAGIQARHDAVDALLGDGIWRTALREALDGVRDVERLAAKVGASRATPRETRALGDSLARLPRVREALDELVKASVLPGTGAGRVTSLLAGWDDAADLAREIQAELVERPPLQIGEEPTIAPGVDSDLDDLRALRDGGRDSIASLQADERARTGINSLKVGYNKVFGYFIEVTHTNAHLVPSDYQRRQTLTGGERYVTPALKEYEERVLTAAERIDTRERERFEALRRGVAAHVARLQTVARRIAELDVLAAFADVAAREGYVRPTMVEETLLDVDGGRHPVVERMMPRDQFIPNDVRLTDDARLIVLTGPNMAGKSTTLRQIGLIALLAQIGSFVPAKRATLGVMDRIFTRVGASDNLARGQSTFMVEMSETSAILHTATSRSLVLLDEIGRGTSTFDGVSIAWSVTEHLHDRIKCLAVFATHYHELTHLADKLSAARNWTVDVREVGEDILFLHRLKPGGASRSYGIEVGRLAGLPPSVLVRARAVLGTLEQAQQNRRRADTSAQDSAQTELAFDAPAREHGAITRLREIEPDALTPLQALTLLSELVAEVRGSQ